MKIQPVEQELVIEEILEGLSKPLKSLPSKFFYDERGSLLFEEITKLNEYYLTKTEIKIMQDNIDEIASCIGEKKILVELGSGSSVKIRLLIEHLPDLAAYIPVDISEEHLTKSSRALKNDYPELEIFPLVTDFTQWFSLPEIYEPFNGIEAFYPGSTIGNFTPEDARNFLKRISTICGRGSGLLIGVDLKKDKQILYNAYNDSKGITAEFNLNILHHINNIFNADFNVNNFHHCAVYNEEQGRIEMYLVSNKAQTVSIRGNKFTFNKGERLITEYSYKYSLNDFSELVKDIYKIEKVWLDDNQFFSVQFLKAI
jgi:dimethylhistidine N-methyltransferase